ncbi:hypothetical protein NUW58_g1001 [Xylaria curta]|uniref:Uncharacterized protein n=1 Tax=Xylaria curta TaxID=42375 RepID=A0ACC1PP41_9PEZI|nr:hypothetical protein NUW58_g1001 [Xylaria curta]
MDSIFGGFDLSAIPAGIPPPGVVPNFVDPPTQAELPKIFIYVTLPPMLAFLGLRIYTRIKYTRLGLDDALCVLSAIAIIAHIALSFAIIGNPAGPHMWDVPLSKITVNYAKFSILIAIMYFVAALFIKASILVLYQRIFRPSDIANILIWICITIVLLFYTISIVVFTIACVPHPEDYSTGGWLSPVTTQRCYNTDGHITIAAGAVGTFVDIYILVIPVLFLSRLRTPTKRKVGLLAVFTVGTAALAFSAAGTYYRSKIVSSSEHQDLSWNAMPIYATKLVQKPHLSLGGLETPNQSIANSLQSVGEINVGIMSSCMPVIFVLFKGFTAWSASWVTRIWSLNSRTRRQKHSTESGDVQMPHYNPIDENNLPVPPKGALTGLKSFMRNFNRTNLAKTQTTNMSLTQVSVDYDYHAQLKQGASVQHKPQTRGSDLL